MGLLLISTVQCLPPHPAKQSGPKLLIQCPLTTPKETLRNPVPTDSVARLREFSHSLGTKEALLPLSIGPLATLAAACLVDALFKDSH